jgi:hypothetical protein
MNYIDGFVAAVPSANKNAYHAFAEKMAVVFKKHGALGVVENWGDDVPEGKLTSFTMAVKREESESIRIHRVTTGLIRWKTSSLQSKSGCYSWCRVWMKRCASTARRCYLPTRKS